MKRTARQIRVSNVLRDIMALANTPITFAGTEAGVECLQLVIEIAELPAKLESARQIIRPLLKWMVAIGAVRRHVMLSTSPGGSVTLGDAHWAYGYQLAVSVRQRLLRRMPELGTVPIAMCEPHGASWCWMCQARNYFRESSYQL